MNTSKHTWIFIKPIIPLIKEMATVDFSTVVESSSRVDKMLKPRIIATELMKKRVEERSRDKKHLILNNASFQILGSDSQGFSPSLLVNSEGNSYLFNCGEGTQRFCYTNKIRLRELENIFITNLDWHRVSGAFGLSLTLQDTGSPGICIHSTEGIDDFFEATSSFMLFNTGMKCTTRTHLEGQYEDSGIRVQPIVLDNMISSNEEQSPKRFKSRTRLIAYVCSFPDLPGALNPQKCRELNVPIGRQLAILKSGQDIVLADGKVVKSVDVCGPKNLGINFIVLDCPQESYINQFVNNSLLDTIRKSRIPNQGKQIDIVIHFSPYDVTNNPIYQEWMKGFPKSCKHLLLSNSESKRINFVDYYRFQYLLQRLDSAIFPQLSLPLELAEKVEEELIYSTSEKDVEIAKNTGEDSDLTTFVKCDLDSLDSIINVSSLDRFVVRPDMSVEVVDHTIAIDALYNDTRLDPHFEEQLNDLRQLQQSLPEIKDYEPEVVFLGTGSALPSKLRNTTCILFNFHLPRNVSVMMDCGEDSYGQMFRLYGPDRIRQVLRQLKMIYVSHHHTDHHIGLIQLLRQRKKFTDEPIMLLLPPGIESLLDYHNQNFEDLSDIYEIFPTKSIKTRPNNATLQEACARTLKLSLYEKLDGLLDEIIVVGVQHCVHSCAVVMRFKIGHPDMKTFTVGYSGDARPSEEFVIAGNKCDLLIHEATFDHRSEKDAISKKHSTSAEAIRVAKQMQAKFTLLTHFSQRLPKIPYFTEDFDEKIGFAFDNMSLRCPSQLERLPILKTILSLTFKKSLEEIDMKFMKNELKQSAIKTIIESKQANE